MQLLEVSGAVGPIYGSLGVKRLIFTLTAVYSTYSIYSVILIFNLYWSHK